jgi:hypothetical protein
MWHPIGGPSYLPKMLARTKAPAFGLLVIPAKAGIQPFRTRTESWIPAFAGMTSHEKKRKSEECEQPQALACHSGASRNPAFRYDK